MMDMTTMTRRVIVNGNDAWPSEQVSHLAECTNGIEKKSVSLLQEAPHAIPQFNWHPTNIHVHEAIKDRSHFLNAQHRNEHKYKIYKNKNKKSTTTNEYKQINKWKNERKKKPTENRLWCYWLLVHAYGFLNGSVLWIVRSRWTHIQQMNYSVNLSGICFSFDIFSWSAVFCVCSAFWFPFCCNHYQFY